MPIHPSLRDGAIRGADIGRPSRDPVAIAPYELYELLPPQVVRERRQRIGELSRGFRWRQWNFEITRAGGWIALNPGMRRSAGIVCGRKRANKLRANLCQG